jgi:hypothetical protein
MLTRLFGVVFTLATVVADGGPPAPATHMPSQAPLMSRDEVTFDVPHDAHVRLLLPVLDISPVYAAHPEQCAALIKSLGTNFNANGAKVVALVAMPDRTGRMRRVRGGNTACVGTASSPTVLEQHTAGGHDR